MQVPRYENIQPLTLTLNDDPVMYGSNAWLKRSTPGSEIVRHDDADDVTGTVVDTDGEPIAGAKVFRDGGPIVLANAKGGFRIKRRKGTQFAMYAFSPGYHVWTGMPTAGDVLRIVLEKKGLPPLESDAASNSP